MPVTDEELQEKAQDVEELRRQIAEVNTNREVAERESANEVSYKQLEAEEARLTAALEAAKSAGTNPAADPEYAEAAEASETPVDEPRRANPTPDPAPAAVVSPVRSVPSPAPATDADQNKEN